MKNLFEYSLTKKQQRLIFGGRVADVTVNCPGGTTIKCSGSSCSGSDDTGKCSCSTGSSTDAKTCDIA